MNEASAHPAPPPLDTPAVARMMPAVRAFLRGDHRSLLPAPRAPFALLLVFSLLAVAIAATMDRAVADAVHRDGMDDWIRNHPAVRFVWKLPGEYATTLLTIGVIAWLHRRRWAATMFVLAATSLVSLNAPIKWAVGRARPFRLAGVAGDAGHRDALDPYTLDLFCRGWRGLLFGLPNVSFPSGHAALAFATAAATAMLFPRWRTAAYAAACAVAVERVAENAHWFSDAIAGAALGMLCVAAVQRLFSPACDAERVSVSGVAT